jgi:hexosaminidase
VNVVKLAIDQVMSLHHPLDGGEFFHMGADEAFQIGMCERCTRAIRDKYNNNREKLMVKHIATIAEYVKQKYNRRILMWHDMLNNVDPQTMKETKLGELVEPMVWAYAENLNDYLMPDMWQRFAQTFPYIWAASAYKGK